MSTVLVVNSGSSSLKYQLIDATTETRIASGLIERIGEPTASLNHRAGAQTYNSTLPIADHEQAFAAMSEAFDATGAPLGDLELTVVGHRVVQGGAEFIAPTLIDDRVAARILALAPLAPLHNPGQHAGIQAARALFPNTPHVAVFDTAFHQSMPQDAYSYAIDAEISEKYSVRRYGFHGTSHQFVSQAAADFLKRPLADLNQIVLHLGNGASVCAVKGGKSVNTSMGMTPLEGLVMGSRSGDLDPSIIFYLNRVAGFSVDEIDNILNKRSGLLGMTGDADMRDVTRRAAAGDEAANLALNVYARRVRKYIGAYMLDLGRLDTLVFTAGVGENASLPRELICAGLENFGLKLDPELNAAPNTGARRISAADSQVEILVIPTDEELAIARQAFTLAGSSVSLENL
ncbi:acetate/propionate family kinase [Canibacter zhoujuaniae]|uniref:acetate/propionate family kinase n=1 Tax=Canibacter zhoujuaniae TaxID=2708343 RepID=UPI00141E2762|nr:acetate kinase [Canibacter zhoujuaniae]